MSTRPEAAHVVIRADQLRLRGILQIPSNAFGIVVLAHGGGSGRHSPRNRYVSAALNEAGLATLLVDLLREEDDHRADRVFDVTLLKSNLGAVVRWVQVFPRTRGLPIGLLGASTGAAAAIAFAASEPDVIQAVISRGGRPDLASDWLPRLRAPTLFVVGGDDLDVLHLNNVAARALNCRWQLAVVPGASHLFEEPGALEKVSKLASAWFIRYLRARDSHGIQVSSRKQDDSEIIWNGDDGWITDEPAPVFSDRRDAAKGLAAQLLPRAPSFHRPLVLAIPRGGAVTGRVVADVLDAELDVVLLRKLGAPGNPEAAIGAITEDGRVLLMDGILGEDDDWKDYVDQESHRQMRELRRRRDLVRSIVPKASIAGRSVILIDDGIATGSTVTAAIAATRDNNPREIILATPVAPQVTLNRLSGLCDAIICLASPADFQSVGDFHASFPPVSDSEMLRLLSMAGESRRLNPREGARDLAAWSAMDPTRRGRASD